MNITTFFQDLVTHFNSVDKCGFCWDYRRAKGESGMNSIRLVEDTKCCVNVILTSRRKRRTEAYNFTTGGVTQEYCDWQFTVYFVRSTSLGKNFGNEIPGHSDEESIDNEIINPLFDCLTCDLEYLCELGYDFAVMQWDAEEVHNVGDQNFSGIRINGTFRYAI